MQIFVQTLSAKTITLDVDLEETVGSVQLQIQQREGIPAEQQRLLSRGRELCSSSSLALANIRNHDSLQVLLSVHGGGGDGGSTCNDRLWVEMRGDILNANGSSFDKRQKQDRDQIAVGKASNCCISSMELEEPVMCCELGYLYNKKPLFEAMVNKTIPEKFAHVKSVKDVVEIKMSTRDNADGPKNADGDGKVGHQCAKFICPVTMRDMNGFNKFCVIRTSRVALSMEAIRQVAKATKTCPISGMAFEPDDDIIRLYPDEDELAVQQKRMIAMKKAAKAARKAARKSDKAAGGIEGKAAAKASKAIKMKYAGGKSNAFGGSLPKDSKRKADQFSQGKIAAETEENLKRMKGSDNFSSLFTKSTDAPKSANDLFNRCNGTLGLRT